MFLFAAVCWAGVGRAASLTGYMFRCLPELQLRIGWSVSHRLGWYGKCVSAGALAIRTQASVGAGLSPLHVCRPRLCHTSAEPVARWKVR